MVRRSQAFFFVLTGVEVAAAFIYRGTNSGGGQMFYSSASVSGNVQIVQSKSCTQKGVRLQQEMYSFCRRRKKAHKKYIMV